MSIKKLTNEFEGNDTFQKVISNSATLNNMGTLKNKS